jgi:hypothetical protein
MLLIKDYALMVMNTLGIGNQLVFTVVSTAAVATTVDT